MSGTALPMSTGQVCLEPNTRLSVNKTGNTKAFRGTLVRLFGRHAKLDPLEVRLATMLPQKLEMTNHRSRTKTWLISGANVKVHLRKRPARMFILSR